MPCKRCGSPIHREVLLPGLISCDCLDRSSLFDPELFVESVLENGGYVRLVISPSWPSGSLLEVTARAA